MDNKDIFADVYVRIPVHGSFMYMIPENLNVQAGCRVKVPFGKKELIGYVARTHSENPDNFKLKSILQLIDDNPIFDTRLIDLAKYTAQTYICSVGEVLGMALPSGISDKSRLKNDSIKHESVNKELTAEQKNIAQNILDGYQNDKKKHLIYGITGSGKTEIYIKVAKEIIKQHKSVIYLVPEISLSSQIFKRLHSVFKDDLVIYHSNLTQNTRLNNWKRFKNGEAKIVIGTRSAVFMQCPELGLIIIDEEHDGAYKEHSTPRYNARRIALYRSNYENSLLVLGSATPSIETFFSSEKGIINLHKIEKRFGNARLPEIEILPVSISKPENMLSSKLKIFTKRLVDKGHQVIYLLNRRGYSPILICDDCGAKVECPECNISLNYHNNGLLVCHYCGYKELIPEKCPACGHEHMVKLGAGTQRIEDIVIDTFHKYKIFRLDQDTARKKDTVFNLVKKMEDGEIDILLGTQMVAKGFDFKNVAMVGILLADIGINLPDFRATERIFSLLLQVAGRCGRGDVPGKVFIQTLDENLDIFKYLVDHDYYSFYKKEIEIRKVLNYPPFTRIARLLVRGRNQEKARSEIERVAALVNKHYLNYKDKIIILGPCSAPIEKVGGNFRYHLILKSSQADVLRLIVKNVYNEYKANGVYLEIDIDPYDML